MEKYQTVIIRVIVIVGVLLALFLVVATVAQVKSYKYIGSGLPAANVITVAGHGEVEKAPDTAKFSFTIQDEKNDTASAQDVVSKKVATVKADLIAAGVEEQYITTDSYNSYPDYEYTNGKQTLKGYMVSQNVKVSVKDLSKTETVTGILGKDGVTSINGPELGFDDSHEVSNEARDAAIADAKVQADKLASQLGVHLVRIVSFNENNNGGGGIIRPMYDMAAAPAANKAPSAPVIPTGVQTVTSDVSITYEIR